jgi:hypothetical protein
MSVVTLTHEFDNGIGLDKRSQQCFIPVLIAAVVRGAAAFLGDEHAQRTWHDCIARLSLELQFTENPLETLREKVSLDGGYDIQAELLLGSILLLVQCERGVTVHHSDTQHRRFTRYIFTMLNVLYNYVGDDAFNIIPALSGKSFQHKTVASQATR